RGILPLDDAPIETEVMNGRPHYPLRPAAVTVCGTMFGTADAAGLSTLPVTWANRNRLTETGAILAWDEMTVAPEDGQTTTVRVRNGSTVLATYTGLTGNSHAVPVTI